MNKFSETEEIETSSYPHVLNHWQVIDVRPMAPCFLPMPGPNFWIVIGWCNGTGRIVRTPKIVAFERSGLTARSASGETYRLGLDIGFTQDMQDWYRRRKSLMVARARDVTGEALSLLKRPDLVHRGAAANSRDGISR